MQDKELLNYKNKLLKEKDRVLKLLEQMEKNEVINSNVEIASELSLYDNHPSDIATETFDIEKGRALYNNEKNLLYKVDNSLKEIENGTYGICKKCGAQIAKERLDFLPYAENCINCQNAISEVETFHSKERPTEESSIEKPFKMGFNRVGGSKLGIDEDVPYTSQKNVNNVYGVEEYYYDDDEYVEEIEKISNEVYKNQLPD
ncbi:transcriptional regulator, TraR/DksA family [Clostridium cavendishii DSM 21758]|uniref:Transcriptional regulator, TraR/DksA family n=1 Tax=Clostridium cavendishii DSM 21758 TaxID=1121302 RepID=A0A1M6KND8_9CLOT|nr:TraR/DksA C4-type zinc finger protein [Clostridium cavendishii]SHJ60447.1 transcriptional regulator, TraR/DksA family [Clostridium cavendishii DSM 21758]